MATALKDHRLQLTDPRLFREQCYVDGRWIDADERKTIKVTDPANGEILGTVPSVGVAETRRAIEAAERALPAWRAKTAKERGAILRKMVRAGPGQRRRPRLPDDPRAGQAAGRGQGRGHLRRLVPRMVRRGGQADLWRRHPADGGVAPDPGDQAARRRVRRDHALELPQRHDHPQGRPGAGRRLHHGGQARLRHALLGAGHGRARRARRRPGRCVQRGHRQLRPDRHRAVHQQDRAQGLVHRLDRGRQDPAQAVRRHGQADLDGAGRPRAVHRLRRCRPRQGGRGGDRLQVQERRPDLRLHQPDLRPGRGLRRLCREVRGRRPQAQGRPRHRQGRDRRPADRRRRRRQGAGACRRRHRQGRQGRDRRQAAPAGRPVLRADHPRQLRRGDEDRARGDLRARWRRCSASRPRRR